MGNESEVSATTLSTALVDNMQSALSGVLRCCDSECNCLLTAGIDTQCDRYLGVVFGCNKRAAVSFECGMFNQG